MVDELEGESFKVMQRELLTQDCIHLIKHLNRNPYHNLYDSIKSELDLTKIIKKRDEAKNANIFNNCNSTTLPLEQHTPYTLELVRQSQICILNFELDSFCTWLDIFFALLCVVFVSAKFEIVEHKLLIPHTKRLAYFMEYFRIEL